MGKTGQTMISPSSIYGMITRLDHCLPCFSHCNVSPSSIYAMIIPLDHCLPCFFHYIVSPSSIYRRTDNTMGKTG
jgi:hypothetical protein